MRKLKTVWTTIFGISTSEYSGFRVLVFTALICCTGLALVNYFSKSPYTNYDKDVVLLDSLLVIMRNNHTPKTYPSIKKNIVPFDPNIVSEEELIKIGFPKRLAKRLINYRSSGARFRKPDDLLKLYNFPNDLYFLVKDSIKIKLLKKEKKKTYTFKKKERKKSLFNKEKKRPVIDLNTADTSVLQIIKGIGSKLSNRIVDYRSALGGFISKNQLYQVYNLDSSIVEILINISTIDSSFTPKKFNINLYTKDQLASHPYISWTEAKLIIAYRNQHGFFKNKKELLKVYSIDESWVKKITPYLIF